MSSYLLLTQTGQKLNKENDEKRNIAALRALTETRRFGRMELVVPDEVVAQTGCSPQELLFGLAVGLVLDGRLTLGRAAGLAGLSKIAFLEELGRRRLPMPYDEQDLEADLLTLREVFPSRKPDRQ